LRAEALSAVIEKFRFFSFYGVYQDNIPFQPQDNFVYIGKNSQIKARKNEQGSEVKITLREYDVYIQYWSLQCCSL